MAQFKPVRIVKTEYGTYSLHFTTPAGRRRRISVGKNYEYVQRLAVRFNDWLIEGKEPEAEFGRVRQQEQMQRVTVRDFFPLFMERHGHTKSNSMQDSYHSSFKNVCRCSQIADAPLGRIVKRDVVDYMSLRMRTDGVSAATVNREAAFLKCMMSRAHEWDILPDNQLKGLKLFKEAPMREVMLTPEQAAALMQELPSPVDMIVAFAGYSGFRKENILGLRIENVRFYDIIPGDAASSAGEALLSVKGGRIERFPIGILAVELLKREIGDRKEGYVFINSQTGTRYTTINKTFDRAVRRLGYTVNGTKLRFHDLRHAFSTWLHQAGVSLDDLKELMGHKHISTTKRYTTVNRVALGSVLDLMPRIGTVEGSIKKASSG